MLSRKVLVHFWAFLDSFLLFISHFTSIEVPSSHLIFLRSFTKKSAGHRINSPNLCGNGTKSASLSTNTIYLPQEQQDNLTLKTSLSTQTLVSTSRWCTTLLLSALIIPLITPPKYAQDSFLPQASIYAKTFITSLLRNLLHKSI